MQNAAAAAFDLIAVSSQEMYRAITLATGSALLLGLMLRADASDLELRNLVISGWSCLAQPAGAAHTRAESERNLSKNRSAAPAAQPASLGIKDFLQRALDFDQQIGGAKTRAELNAAQKAKLAEAEKNVVSLTGWLVQTYPGPAESTNCNDAYYHDWHLELLEQPLEHVPGLGDPTAVICEITPRTEAYLYGRQVRLRDLAAYIRAPDGTVQSTGHPAHKVRLTGYLMWDDGHNTPEEVGPIIKQLDAQKLGRPWRRTAWELHPIWDVVDLGSH